MERLDPEAPTVRVDLASPRVAVAVVNDRPPSDHDWADYVETTSALGDAHHRTVVFTTGGGPTALQRAEFERAVAGHRDVRLAVIQANDGAVSRWQRPHAKAFWPDELDEAFGFLELSARERARVMLLARRFARELDVSDRFFGPAAASGSAWVLPSEDKPRDAPRDAPKA